MLIELFLLKQGGVLKRIYKRLVLNIGFCLKLDEVTQQPTSISETTRGGDDEVD